MTNQTLVKEYNKTEQKRKKILFELQKRGCTVIIQNNELSIWRGQNEKSTSGSKS